MFVISSTLRRTGASRPRVNPALRFAPYGTTMCRDPQHCRRSGQPPKVREEPSRESRCAKGLGKRCVIRIRSWNFAELECELYFSAVIYFDISQSIPCSSSPEGVIPHDSVFQ